MDDFSKPKIVYPETTQGAFFTYDTNAFYADKTCFIMITNFPLYIQSTLSSKLFEYAYKRIFSSIELGASGYQYNKHAFVKLPIHPTEEDSLLSDSDIYALYALSQSEIVFIESQCSQ